MSRCETSSGLILPTHDDVAFDIGLDGGESGRTQEIYVSGDSPEREGSLGAFSLRHRNTDAPNNPKRPSDASRNARVSTPASVMGTSAKDLPGNEHENDTTTGTAG